MPRSPGSRRIRKRSWVTTTQTGPLAKILAHGRCGHGWFMAARRRLPLEFSVSSNTANSFISGSDGSIDQRPAAFPYREPVHHAGGGGAQFCGRSLADLPAVTAISGGVFAGQPPSERRADQEPDV